MYIPLTLTALEINLDAAKLCCRLACMNDETLAMSNSDSCSFSSTSISSLLLPLWFDAEKGENSTTHAAEWPLP